MSDMSEFAAMRQRDAEEERLQGSAKGTKCPVCQHEKCAEIDQAIANGVPRRELAYKYQLSETSLKVHQKWHTPDLPPTVLPTLPLEILTSTIAVLGEALDEAVNIVDVAYEDGNYTLVLKGLQEQTRIVAMIVKLAMLVQDRESQASEDSKINFFEKDPYPKGGDETLTEALFTAAPPGAIETLLKAVEGSWDL